MKYEQYENEERFAALERRVEKLEATIIKLLAQAKTSEKAIERNEMREWNNHLGKIGRAHV